MACIYAYLTFNGNCTEAMQFYKSCLGGELSLQVIGDSPMASGMPAKMKKSVLHATLSKNGFTLMASDMVGESGLVKGNAISILLHCSTEHEIKTLYKKLSAGGTATHPPAITFWGALFGDLTDKYGNQWLLHFDKKSGQ